MKDKLTVIDRRKKIVEYISYHKKTTCKELSEEFKVSIHTVWRDIVYISKHEPIYTQKGGGGGIYILSQHRDAKYYLSEEEEILLISLLDKLDEHKAQILKGIIYRFSRGNLSNK